ncbi:uncharacterized protein LOC115771416 [Drosophila novamexicana]|uniref:uncharacterized protein LOC115771416 n=1 Tax=Drosophila novamexicana TaxID=47314 RepID=UPI0011E5DBCC|nr:uncharacterized protein LOC115771416 [Drosophila novamexicana]
MKLYINFLLPAFLFGLIALSQLPYGNARALVSPPGVMASANATGSLKTNVTNQNATIVLARDTDRSNDTAVTTLPAQTKSLEMSQSTGSTVVTNIVRRKRAETEPTLPFDFHTMHLPCDLDQNGRAQVVDAFPNHCIWVWNNKFVHEGFYRVFKTYQLEGFFFGQYYERLKRFEIDPHSWDYSNTGF